MNKKNVKLLIEVLEKNFPDKPMLNFNTPFELLVAVILSAQCTDERVNKVTKELFKEYNTPEKMSKIDVSVLEKYIFSCGLYKNKARFIISASRDIINKYNGQVPTDLENLRKLSGVGRKTANVVYSVAFKGNAIAVDTHVFRVSNRLGLVKEKDVLKTELGLMKVIEEKDWSRSHHYLIYLGRKFCKASSPDCKNCPVKDLCDKRIKKR